MLGSIALQSSAAALRSAATSSALKLGTSVRWNRPPLNHEMLSAPKRPPSRIVVKRPCRPRRKTSGSAARLPTRRSKMRSGSRPTSSAKKQKRHWVSRCEVTSAGTPAARNRSAVVAKAFAASSVICRLVRRGLKLSGALKQRRSSSRWAGSPSSSSRTTWHSLGVPLKWV